MEERNSPQKELSHFKASTLNTQEFDSKSSSINCPETLHQHLVTVEFCSTPFSLNQET